MLKLDGPHTFHLAVLVSYQDPPRGANVCAEPTRHPSGELAALPSGDRTAHYATAPGIVVGSCILLERGELPRKGDRFALQHTKHLRNGCQVVRTGPHDTGCLVGVESEWRQVTCDGACASLWQQAIRLREPQEGCCSKRSTASSTIAI